MVPLSSSSSRHRHRFKALFQRSNNLRTHAPRDTPDRSCEGFTAALLPDARLCAVRTHRANRVCAFSAMCLPRNDRVTVDRVPANSCGFASSAKHVLIWLTGRSRAERSSQRCSTIFLPGRGARTSYHLVHGDNLLATCALLDAWRSSAFSDRVRHLGVPRTPNSSELPPPPPRHAHVVADAQCGEWVPPCARGSQAHAMAVQCCADLPPRLVVATSLLLASGHRSPNPATNSATCTAIDGRTRTPRTNAPQEPNLRWSRNVPRIRACNPGKSWA